MAIERSKQKDIFLKSVGEKVKQAREEKELSQFQLSIEADIPKNQIGRIERGEINTSIFTLKRIANTLNVPITKLLD